MKIMQVLQITRLYKLQGINKHWGRRMQCKVSRMPSWDKTFGKVSLVEELAAASGQ